LLDELKDDELKELFEKLDFLPLTLNTITDPKKLKKEIERIRKQGYATSFGERTVGSAAISVPIKYYVMPYGFKRSGSSKSFFFEGNI
jgi:IclR family pca regulon transcriptional regulator